MSAPPAAVPFRQITDFGRRSTLITRQVSWSPDGHFIYAAVIEQQQTPTELVLGYVDPDNDIECVIHLKLTYSDAAIAELKKWAQARAVSSLVPAHHVIVMLQNFADELRGRGVIHD